MSKYSKTEFTKDEERYYINLDRDGDFMTLEVHKSCEYGNYRIEKMELQMWQNRKQIVNWLRWCADRIEKDLP